MGVVLVTQSPEQSVHSIVRILHYVYTNIYNIVSTSDKKYRFNVPFKVATNQFFVVNVVHP